MANEAKTETKPKSVVLKPGDSLKHVVTLGGFAGLFIRPDAPTEVSAEMYERLQKDVGFARLVEAGKISVQK